MPASGCYLGDFLNQTVIGNVVTEDDTRVADDEGTIPKAPTAVDFSRF